MFWVQYVWAKNYKKITGYIQAHKGEEKSSAPEIREIKRYAGKEKEYSITGFQGGEYERLF